MRPAFSGVHKTAAGRDSDSLDKLETAMRWILFVLSMAAMAQAEWPQFRGPSASGLAPGSPPVEWNGESGRNILWKTPIPGLGLSSPIVWGDKIFLTTAVPVSGEAVLKIGLYGNIQPVEGEGEQEFQVYCLNRHTGEILWRRTAARTVPRIKRHPKSSHANPTPATDGKRLIAFFGSEGLYAYDLNGNLQWSKDFGVLDAGYFQVPQAQWGFASSPVIHNGAVIVLADVQKNSFLAAFSSSTGKQIWRTPRNDVPTFGTPTVAPYTARGARSLQIVVNGFQHSGGYDFKTGRQLWKLTGGGDIPVPTPVSSEGLVILTSAHGKERPIFAVRTDASGELTRDQLAWQVERGGNYMQTPLVAEGLAYFCYDNGVLTVYRLANGERVYQQRLGAGATGFTSSPVAAGGRLYLTDENGRTYVIALGQQFQLLKENELGEPVMATPAIAGDVLYLRGRRHLWAIGVK